MTEADPRAEYRSIIDELVRECLEGQGTVLPLWVRRGKLPQEREINVMLARLSPEDRALIARMLRDAYWGAVHDALRVLNDNQVPPFDQSYEGTAISRLRRPTFRRVGLAGLTAGASASPAVRATADERSLPNWTHSA